MLRETDVPDRRVRRRQRHHAGDLDRQERARDDGSRPITLVYANRSDDAVIFGAELERLRAASGDRLSVHHHLDSERGFLDAARCAALVGERAHADFYICGPGPYMDTVEAGLAIARRRARAACSSSGSSCPATSPPSTTTRRPSRSTIRLQQRTHTVAYQPGDTLLETARRGGLQPPFSCELGNCATCMAHLDVGSATMRANNALTADEVDTGWVLTCQAVPTSREVVVDYDA